MFVEGRESADPENEISGHDRGRDCSFGVGSPEDRQFPQFLACSWFQAREPKPPVGEDQFRFSLGIGEDARSGISQALAFSRDFPSDFPGRAIQGVVGSAPFFLIIGNDQQIFENNG